MIDMVLKNKTGISYANELTIFVIVYGLSGYFNNVNTSVWDRLFEVTNNSIKFETSIDMNNHEVKKIADGVEDNDAVNIKQLNSKISELDIPSKVHYYTSKLAYNEININQKIIEFTSIMNYIISNNSHFTSNNDRITVSKSGIYQIYFQQKIKTTKLTS